MLRTHSIDYTLLSRALCSPGGEKIRHAITIIADHHNVGDYVREALFDTMRRGTSTPKRVGSIPVDTDHLRASFARFETYYRNNGHGAQKFSDQMEHLLSYSNRVIDVHEMSSWLLDTKGGAGVFLVRAEVVRAHIRFVRSMFKKMGNKYLSDPLYWKELIEYAHTDLHVSSLMVRRCLPGEKVPGEEVKDVPDLSQFVQKMRQLIGKHSERGDPERQGSLRAIDTVLPKALDMQDYDTLLQLLLESWMHISEILEPYHKYDSVMESGPVRRDSPVSPTRATPSGGAHISIQDFHSGDELISLPMAGKVAGAVVFIGLSAQALSMWTVKL
jgi:hypothetical protein